MQALHHGEEVPVLAVDPLLPEKEPGDSHADRCPHEVQNLPAESKPQKRGHGHLQYDHQERECLNRDVPEARPQDPRIADGHLVPGRPDEGDRHQAEDGRRRSERHSRVRPQESDLFNRALADGDCGKNPQERAGPDLSLDDESERPEEEHVEREVDDPPWRKLDVTHCAG